MKFPLLDVVDNWPGINQSPGSNKLQAATPSHGGTSAGRKMLRIALLGRGVDRLDEELLSKVMVQRTYAQEPKMPENDTALAKRIANQIQGRPCQLFTACIRARKTSESNVKEYVQRALAWCQSLNVDLIIIADPVGDSMQEIRKWSDGAQENREPKIIYWPVWKEELDPVDIIDPGFERNRDRRALSELLSH